MKLGKKSGFGTFATLFPFLLLLATSNGSPSRIIKRSPESGSVAPEPEPESTPIITVSLPPSSTPGDVIAPEPTPSSLESTPSPEPESEPEHDLNKCSVNLTDLKTSCPNDDSCSADTMELCCLCLSTCCGSTSTSSEDSVGSMMGSSTEKPGKSIGNKVKDAVNSAEGWIKNAGQNIKNTWNKAKERISDAANDASEKVKKEISKIRNSNSSSHNHGECKDGRCSSTDSSKGFSSSPFPDSGTDYSTPVPGMQKSKRDLTGMTIQRPYYSPSSVYNTRYANSGMGGRDMDNSDSREYAWSKTTTTTTGGRGEDFNRRYRRDERNSMMNRNTSNSSSYPSSPSSSPSSTQNNSPDRSGRNGRSSSSGSQPAPSSGGNPSSTGGGGMREGSTNSPSNTYGSNNGPSNTFTSSTTPTNARRTRAAEVGTTEKSHVNITTVTTPGLKQKREAKASSTSSSSGNSRGSGGNRNSQNGSDSNTNTSSEEETEEDEDDSDHRGNYGQSSNNINNNGNRGDKHEDPNLSISVKVLSPMGSASSTNETKYSFSTGSLSKGSGRYNNRHNNFDIRSVGTRGSGFGEDDDNDYYNAYGHSSSTSGGYGHAGPSIFASTDYDSDSHHFHPVYPVGGSDGGVIAGPQMHAAPNMNEFGGLGLFGGGIGGRGHGHLHNSNYYNRHSSYNHNNYDDRNSNGSGNYNDEDDDDDNDNDNYSGRGSGSGTTSGGRNDYGSSRGGVQRQSKNFYNGRTIIRSTRKSEGGEEEEGSLSSASGENEPYTSSSSTSSLGISYNPILAGRPGPGVIGQGSIYDQIQMNGQGYYNPNRHYHHHNNQERHQNNGGGYGWNMGNSNNNGYGSNYGSNSHGMSQGVYSSTQQSHHSNNNNNGWGNMNSGSGSGYGSSYGTSSSSSSSGLSSDLAYGKPGQCKPLSTGIHCLNLHPDSAQCLYDKDCSGSKKCCFYGCTPNHPIGICEYPVGGEHSNSDHHHHHDHNHHGY